jgi:hypothetical protein
MESSRRRRRGFESEPPAPPPEVSCGFQITHRRFSPKFLRVKKCSNAAKKFLGQMDVADDPANAMSATRDWSALPLDVLVSIFTKVGAVDVLITGTGLVCHSWLQAAKVPDLWRSVDMANHSVDKVDDDDVLRALAKVAVDRSEGQLEVFLGKLFVTDELLMYIADRYSLISVLDFICVQYTFILGLLLLFCSYL